jgi:hypothetical protein
MKSSPEKAGFFFSNKAQARLQAAVRKEKSPSHRLVAFHVDYGAVRKTERSEGNPGEATRTTINQRQNPLNPMI